MDRRRFLRTVAIGSFAEAWCELPAPAFASSAPAEFGMPGGPEPVNIEQTLDVLRQDKYDLELVISFGTSKGGSAGHIALAIRNDASVDDTVYSANFYADRAPEHAKGFYNQDLVIGVPKKEYLFKTSSSLGATASFGLDFGEIYKRSVVGVRVYNVPAGEKAALTAYFERINDDYRNRAANTEYHRGEIVYSYFDLNCAKIVGAAFRYGAGYRTLEVKSGPIFARRKVKAAMKSNVPTEMAMKLLKEWDARNYRMDVVHYRKYQGSSYVDPHEVEKVAFKDLPDRFPSVVSLDFTKEQGQYQDFDNLFAMYLLYNLGRYSIRVNGDTRLLELEKSKAPMPYREAARLAAQSAKSDTENFHRRSAFKPKGTAIGE